MKTQKVKSFSKMAIPALVSPAVAAIVAFIALPLIDSSIIKPKTVASACEGALKGAETFVIESFLLNETDEDPVTLIPAEPTYKKVAKNVEVDASCPASINYNGEQYEFTYTDLITNQKSTVRAPKEFVTLEKADENEIPSVKVTTIIAPTTNYYGELMKQSKTDNDKIEISKYVVRS